MTDLKLLALDSRRPRSHLRPCAGRRRARRRHGLCPRRPPLCPADEPLRLGNGRRAAATRACASAPLCISMRVQSVVTAGFDPDARRRRARTAGHHLQPIDGPAGIVELSFAGGGTVRLGVECLEARLPISAPPGPPRPSPPTPSTKDRVMPIRLDSADADFEPRFAALLGSQARSPARTSATPSPPSSPMCARAATTAVVELTNRFDRAGVTAADSALLRRRDRRRRRPRHRRGARRAAVRP